MLIALTFDRRTYRFHSDKSPIRIGTALDNEISRPGDTRLAPVHALVRYINGRWIVESSSRDQVRIGDRRPVPFAWLNSGDVVRLTASGPELIFESLTPISLPTDDSPGESQPRVTEKKSPVAAVERRSISPWMVGAVLIPLVAILTV